MSVFLVIYGNLPIFAVVSDKCFYLLLFYLYLKNNLNITIMNKADLNKLLPLIQIEFELKTKEKVLQLKAVNENEIEIVIAIEGSIFTPKKDYRISFIDLNTKQLTVICDAKVFKESIKFYKNITKIKSFKKDKSGANNE